MWIQSRCDVWSSDTDCRTVPRTAQKILTTHTVPCNRVNQNSYAVRGKTITSFAFVKLCALKSFKSTSVMNGNKKRLLKAIALEGKQTIERFKKLPWEDQNKFGSKLESTGLIREMSSAKFNLVFQMPTINKRGLIQYIVYDTNSWNVGWKFVVWLTLTVEHPNPRSRLDGNQH